MVHWIGTRRPQRRLRIPLRLQACSRGPNRRRITWNRGMGWLRFGRSSGSPRQTGHGNRVRTGTQRSFKHRHIFRAERPLQNRRRYLRRRIAGNDGRRRPRFGRGTGSPRQPVGCGRAGHRIGRSRIHIRSPLPTGAGFAALQWLRNRGVGRGGVRGVFRLGRGGFRVRRHPRPHHIDRGRGRQGGPWSGNRDGEAEGDPGRIRRVGWGRDGTSRSGTRTFRRRRGFPGLSRPREGRFSGRLHACVDARLGSPKKRLGGVRFLGGIRQGTWRNRARGRHGTGRQRGRILDDRDRNGGDGGRRRSDRALAGTEGTLEQPAKIRPDGNPTFGGYRDGCGESVDRVLREDEGEGVRAGKAGRSHFLGVLCISRRRRVSSAARFTPSLPALDIASRTPATTSSFIR
jgi:hypothetical protein